MFSKVYPVSRAYIIPTHIFYVREGALFSLIIRIVFNSHFPVIRRGPDESRPADVRERARHPGVRHDVRDEKRRRTAVHAGAARPLQPGADNQATGQAAEDTPFVGRLLQQPAVIVDHQ